MWFKSAQHWPKLSGCPMLLMHSKNLKKKSCENTPVKVFVNKLQNLGFEKKSNIMNLTLTRK